MPNETASGYWSHRWPESERGLRPRHPRGGGLGGGQSPPPRMITYQDGRKAVTETKLAIRTVS
jgi:hypothetical protein